MGIGDLGGTTRVCPMDETAASSTSAPKHRFFVEFRKEFVSALVVVPIVWIIARLLQIEPGRIEFVAAPIILAWFAVRGWKTEEATWPGQFPIWKFIPKFLLATITVVGLPLLIYSIVYGCVLLFQFHDPPDLVIFGYIAVVAVSSILLWAGRKTALRLALSYLGLSHATLTEKARFGFYWSVSLALLAKAMWPEPFDFNRLCSLARQASSDIVSPVSTLMEGLHFSECAIQRQGDGYAVTIGAVSGGDAAAKPYFVHYNAILYPNGQLHHIELIRRDPRDGLVRS